jgi:hypothetical protein
MTMTDYSTNLPEYVLEQIKLVPNELSHDDGVGLWQIVSLGKNNLGLSEQALVDFTRGCVAALLDAGAIPIVSRGKGKWRPENKYGVQKAEIIENITKEWFVNRRDPPQPWDVWFGLPSNLDLN